MSEPYMSLTWTDAETGARGYLVIDALIRGLAGGGLRMRRGCTLAEVSDLARAMSRKEAIAFRPGARYLPLGGAKGGIDFDPDEPRARGVLRRYLQAMLPLSLPSRRHLEASAALGVGGRSGATPLY